MQVTANRWQGYYISRILFYKRITYFSVFVFNERWPNGALSSIPARSSRVTIFYGQKCLLVAPAILGLIIGLWIRKPAKQNLHLMGCSWVRTSDPETAKTNWNIIRPSPLSTSAYFVLIISSLSSNLFLCILIGIVYNIYIFRILQKIFWF